MSGIQSGTRLDRLQAVHRATRLQHHLATRAGNHTHATRLALLLEHLNDAIHHEQHSTGTGTPPQQEPRRPTPRTGLHTTDTNVQNHLARLGVTSHDVKTWAVTQGLLPAVVRGRVAANLVHAYELHQLEQAGHIRRTTTQEPTP